MDNSLGTNDWVNLLLQSAAQPIDGLLAVCQRTGKTFRYDIARALAEATKRLIKTGVIQAADVLRQLAAAGGLTAEYVAAQLQPAVETLQGLLAVQARMPGPDADLLLEIARLQRADDSAAAVDSLRLALLTYPGYGWYVKAQPVIDKLMQTPAWQPRRKVRIALLSSSTTALLAPMLRCSGFARGIDLAIYEGAYGNYEQEILDPASGLYAARPEVVLVLLNSRDIDFGPVDTDDQATRFVQHIRELWATAQRNASCHIIQAGFDLPAPGPWGSLEDTLPLGRRRQVRKANLALSEDLPPAVSFLDVESLSRLHDSSWRTDAQWHTSKQYPSLTALPVLADAIAAHVAAAFGLTGKVLALDLDNTCWAGVIGEDGLGGIKIGPPDATGEAHAELQRYARQLQQRGILLTVCSKNNPADAEEPFAGHDGMVLRREDFVAFTANWQDKATNLAQQADDLQLGIDSFVFLDDSGLERIWVRRQTQATVPECGTNAVDMLASLRRGMFFEAVALTGEDLKRFGSYQSIARQKQVERSGADLGTFLAGLHMKCSHGLLDDRVLARVAQLVNKTNQFNLTSHRYTETQLQAMADSPDWWCRWFRLEDRFGDHGLVGVILARKGPRQWDLDTWLMSCRVLGRQMEAFMVRQVLCAAREAGVRAVQGLYVPTARNELVRDLYPRMGFQSAGPEGLYRFDLPDQPMPVCEFIADGGAM